MRVLIAPDKFKGTASARAIAEAVAAELATAGVQSSTLPLADGGEGILDAFGGPNRVDTVMGPLGTPVRARWRLGRDIAVIEMAEASGLVLAGGAEANAPIEATTRGTGELITAAITRGARRVVVGLGGSATTDGGWGALQAIGSPQQVRSVEVLVACDVRTTFIDSARVFAPQKGASPPQVAFLESRLNGLATRYFDDYGVDVRALVGGGAAGGLAGGLAAFGAELVGGFDLIADLVGLDEAMAEVDLVITGEGQVDPQSFNGKVVGGVVEAAAHNGLPVFIIAGRVDARTQVDDSGSPVEIVSLSERCGPERAMTNPLACVAQVIAQDLQLLRTLAESDTPSS